MKWMITVIVAGLLVFVGAGFWLRTGIVKTPVPAPVPQEQVEIQKEVEEGPSIEKQFEGFLNAFLRSVNAQVRDYKKQRKILAEAVRPVNLRAPEYVEENSKLVQETTTELRYKMEALMQTFSQGEGQVKALLVSQPPEVRDVILNQWQKMEEKQVSAYITFFMIEEDIITVYEELMAFYSQKPSDFSIEPISDKMIFQNPEDEVRNLAFLKTIEVLSKKQGEALRKK